MENYKENKVIKEIKKFDKKMLKNVDRNKIKEMYKQGFTLQQICKKLNYSLGVVWYASKKVAEIKRNNQLKQYQEHLNNINDFDMGYIVGIIEGEGCLMIVKDENRHRVGLSISNRDKRMITHFSKLLPLNPHKNKIHKYKKYLKNTKRKEWGEIYEYKTHDKKLMFLILNKLFPFMITKKTEVKLMLDFLKTKNKKKQEQIRKKFLLVKHKKNLGVKLI